MNQHFSSKSRSECLSVCPVLFRFQQPVHSTTSKPPQHRPDEEELDSIELPELETQAPILHHSKRASVPPSSYIPWMGGKMYVMNVQTNINQNEEKGLVYNHDKARVPATVIPTFNKCMEHIVMNKDNSMLSPIA